MALRGRLRGRDFAAVGLGVAAGLLVVAAQMAGILGGTPLLALFALTALAIPSSGYLNDRLLLAACTALGWLPLLWVARSPVHALTRLGILTAVVLVAIVTWVARTDSRTRLRLLLPRVGLNELGVAAALVYSVWLYLPLLRVQDARRSLQMLGLGWDFAEHYDMAETIQVSGSLWGTAWPASDHWSNAYYPKGSHAVTATVMEVLGHTTNGVGRDLAPYVHAMAIVSIASVIAVVAGLGALPALRGRPLLAIVLMAVAALAFTTGRGGGEILITGFPNFLVGCALLACVPLIVVPFERLDRSAHLAALSGSLVGIAHSWALLVVPAAVGALVVLLPASRRRWRMSARGWATLLAAGTVTLVGLLTAWVVLRSDAGSSPGFLLLAGPFYSATPSELALAGLSGLVGALGVVVVHSRIPTPDGGQRARTVGLTAMLAVGWAVAGMIAVYQWEHLGGLWYYFWKYATAMQLLSVVIGLVGVAMLSTAWSAPTGRSSRVLAAVLLVMIPPVASGVVDRTSSGVGLKTPAGLHARQQWRLAARAVDRQQNQREMALEVALEVAPVAEDDPRLHVIVPTSLADPALVRLQNVWLFALTHRWSADVFDAVEALWGDATAAEDRPRDPRDAIVDLQRRLPDVVVLVSAETWQALAAQPDPRVDLSRVRHW